MGSLTGLIARIDKQNRTGSGSIATLTFMIPAGSEGQVMRLYFDEVKLVNNGGTEIHDYKHVWISSATDMSISLTVVVSYALIDYKESCTRLSKNTATCTET
jgi:hypothetical protein